MTIENDKLYEGRSRKEHITTPDGKKVILVLIQLVIVSVVSWWNISEMRLG